MNKIIFPILFLLLFVTGCAIKGPVASTADGAVSASALTLTSGVEGAWDVVSVKQRSINPVTGEYDGEYSSKVLIVPKNALAGELLKGAVAAGGQIGSAVLLPGVRSRNYSNFAPGINVNPNVSSQSGSEANIDNSIGLGGSGGLILD